MHSREREQLSTVKDNAATQPNRNKLVKNTFREKLGKKNLSIRKEKFWNNLASVVEARNLNCFMTEPEKLLELEIKPCDTRLRFTGIPKRGFKGDVIAACSSLHVGLALNDGFLSFDNAEQNPEVERGA